MTEPLQHISVSGLGRLGLPTAALLAAKGVSVTGVDIDAGRVAAINAGLSPVDEADLDTLVARAVANGSLRALQRPVAADAFIISVPTPVKEDRSPDLCALRAAAQALAPVLAPGNLVLLESTSPVGTTEALCDWLAAARPDLTFPHRHGEASDIRVAYCPERVLPGQALDELVRNARVIGGITPVCARAAVRLYRIFSAGECHLTGARTAELVKLAENACRDVNIAFANELSLVCHELGIDPWEMISLANQHPRVNILRPGPGVGGHCIPVDPWFITASAPHLTPLIRSARQVNDGKPAWVADQVIAACDGLRQPVVACLGLAYKADVGDLRESPALAVVRQLQESLDGRILVVEPHVAALPAALAEHDATTLVDLDSALDAADVIVLLTDHREFGRVDRDRLAGKPVIDPRGFWMAQPGRDSTPPPPENGSRIQPSLRVMTKR